MTRQEAYRILGLCGHEDAGTIKIQYRRLMLQHHPDAELYRTKEYDYTAAEINEAYTWLTEQKENSAEDSMTRNAEDISREKKSGFGKDTILWNAPQNPNAYFQREIFEEVLDYDGRVIGVIPIARGKYYWSKEEPFALFMRSIRLCCEDVLTAIDRKLKRRRPEAAFVGTMAELAFLLAQQMIDAEDALSWLCSDVTEEWMGTKGEEESGSDLVRIYLVRASLERNSGTNWSKGGRDQEAILLPSRHTRNRLYVKSGEGNELGYLSFPDDRLYYVVIPLVTSQRVQVRLEHEPGDKDRIRMFLRYDRNSQVCLPENLKEEIRKCLHKYSNTKA